MPNVITNCSPAAAAKVVAAITSLNPIVFSEVSTVTKVNAEQPDDKERDEDVRLETDTYPRSSSFGPET